MHFSEKLFYSLFISGIFSFQAGYTQSEVKNESVLFEGYKNDQSLLSDFSYVRYHNGETEIPKIEDYKVFDVTKFGAILHSKR